MRQLLRITAFTATAIAVLSACQAPADRGDDAERFVGTYSFNGGSHSFQPCGGKVIYPLVPG
ncbi:MAG TPA: hypothetical protein VHL57_10830, partial [Flavobacteriales bacterium]|nr:hypothetical protein [Flavobacteriales bacterium]